MAASAPRPAPAPRPASPPPPPPSPDQQAAALVAAIMAAGRSTPTPQTAEERQTAAVVVEIMAAGRLADVPAKASAVDQATGISCDVAAVLASTTIPADCLPAPARSTPKPKTAEELIAEIVAAAEADGVYEADKGTA